MDERKERELLFHSQKKEWKEVIVRETDRKRWYHMGKRDSSHSIDALIKSYEPKLGQKIGTNKVTQNVIVFVCACKCICVCVYKHIREREREREKENWDKTGERMNEMASIFSFTVRENSASEENSHFCTKTE